MNLRYRPIFVLVLLAVLATGCGEAQFAAIPSALPPSAAPSTATPEIPDTLPPSPTVAPEPVDTPLPVGLDLDVPAGTAPAIDGEIPVSEWSDARTVELPGGGELLLKHDGAYLYLGIRAEAAGLGSICLDRGDEVAILHSSAALGTAVYQRDNGNWKLTRRFTWTCRGTGHSQKELKERDAHLRRAHWLASNSNMGHPAEMEFQIALPEGGLRLAVNYYAGQASSPVVRWPADLSDGCQEIALIEGNTPPSLQFSPETWVTLRPSKPDITGSVAPAGDGVVQGWAVLAEKNDYTDVGMTDLPVEHIDTVRMRGLLESAGWDASHIQELREFDRDALTQGLEWLGEKADEDDIVLLFVAGHAKYLDEIIGWDTFFPDRWSEIASKQRLLIVTSCLAAKFTGLVDDDPAPHLSIAASDRDELTWCGLEEEGLPIIGGVFTYYFTEAFADSEADLDGNDWISVQEAAGWAEQRQRAYMHDVVFAVPEFLEMYHEIGFYPERDPTFPDVIVDDAIGEPLYLALDAYSPVAAVPGLVSEPGVFHDSGQCLGQDASTSVALGDLDGDGDLDALVGNDTQGGAGSSVWLNDGGAQGGSPATFNGTGQDLGSAWEVAVGDLDGDGDLDAFLVDWQQPARVWLNDGTGTFRDSGQRLQDSAGFGAAMGDVDDDGDLDLIVASLEANTVWLNEAGDQGGTPGVFVDSGQRLGSAVTADVSLTDLDGDGDLDVLAGGWDEPARVWLNEGGAQGGQPGTFVESGHTLSRAEIHIHGLSLGDIDGDGDLDVMLAIASGDPNEVWLSEANAIFVDSGQELRSALGHDVALRDLDGDGDLDAFMANGAAGGSGNTVSINQGGLQAGIPGVFADSGQRLGHAASFGVALGDPDGDGDLDAFVANRVFGSATQGECNHVWLNGTAARR